MKKTYTWPSLLLISMVLIVLLSFVLHSATAFAKGTHAHTVPQHYGVHTLKTSSEPLGCHDDTTCDGKSPWYTDGPNGEPCITDEEPLEQIVVQGAWVTLSGSVNCGTNWAEISQTQLNSIVDANITRLSDGRHYDAVSYGTAVSGMIYSPTTPARACGSANNHPGGCTPWF